ncbi:hypothetical protein OAL59_04105 [Nitrosopumilus sp.]|nr:hypothetical protein [Nitrosopumilus sp.]
MNNLKSELIAYSPNVNSLMKISLVLIFFTILSTAFVYADDSSFDVPYTTTGMTITEIESDTESMSLIFSVDVHDLNGTLNVVLDRSFFDSVYNKIYTDFIILADGDYALFEETEINSNTRTLSITVPSGTEDIEIIGSILDASLPIILVDSDENKSPSHVIDKAAADKAAADKAAADKAAQTQCGPGTILEGNACVLDDRCGPGTILEGNACVLDSTLAKSSAPMGYTKELIMSVTITLGIAGIVGIILALVARANKNKNKN